MLIIVNLFPQYVAMAFLPPAVDQGEGGQRAFTTWVATALRYTLLMKCAPLRAGAALACRQNLHNVLYRPRSACLIRKYTIRTGPI